MTQDEIIAMARYAGIEDSNEYNHLVCTEVELLAFAKLIAEREREACAKLCDGLVNDENTIEYANGAYRCSALIRSRGQA